MINATMREMENRFKADLNGWLEYVSKYSLADRLEKTSNHSENCIIKNFVPTMSYYGDSKEAKEAFHNVIFYALTKQKDFKTDFDLPRFKSSITDKDYIDLVQYYELHALTRRELWKMDPEPALEFLHRLYQESSTKLAMFYKTHIQLTLDVEDNDCFESWTKILISELRDFYGSSYSTTSTKGLSYSYQLAKTIYDCIDNAFQLARRQPDKKSTAQRRVQKLFHCWSLINYFHSSEQHFSVTDTENLQQKRRIFNLLYATIQLAKENGFKETSKIKSHYSYFSVNEPGRQILFYNEQVENRLVSNKRPTMPLTLKEFAKIRNCQEATEDHHEYTFRTIIAYILREALPNNMDEHSIKPEEETAGFDRLEQVIRSKYGTRPIKGTKLGCLYIIRDRDMFWKSTLKAIIQFSDLWISDIEDAKCVDLFASLIAQENMLPVLYKHILKHVQHYNLMDNSTTVEMIKNLSKLLEKSFDCVESNQELLIFRDHVFNSRDVNENIRTPTLGSSSLWNIPFDREIIRVTNQITSFEEDAQVPEDVIRKLIILSIIWPYEVVHQLFLTCIQNKNQYKATVPVLNNLGNLCVLGRRGSNACKEQEDALLILVLKDTIAPENSELIDKYMGSISQFIKYCCYHKEFDQEFPLILKPNSLVDQELLLLNLKDVLDYCILQNLTSFFHHDNNTHQHTTLLRFALYLLNSFCESSSTNTYDWTVAIMAKSDLPAVLYCSPETYLVCLTEILALRFSNEEKPLLLRLQDWEYALNYIEKISIIVQFGLKSKPEEFPLLNQFFTETLYNYNWKSQLLWYNITRGMTKHTLHIPSAFFQITGVLDDLFVVDGKDALQTSPGLEGWYDLFTACKLSTRLIDELFEHAEQWMYNLLLLWKHPNEDTIVQTCLHYVLHPNTSISVSIEYSNLLTHFLGKLYDSFTGVHQLIRDYNVYEQANMAPIIQDLSEKGTKQYFIVLYTILLLKKTVAQSQEPDDKQDNYYILSLIKVIQGLTHWGSISQRGQATSYNELKTRTRAMINPDIPANDNTTNGKIEQTPILVDNTEPKIIYYPLLNTAELVSDRALSILTLYHLCTLFDDRATKVDENQQQVIERLMLQIMEGFIDMPSRQSFHRMLRQQPKSRITNWKKRKSNSKFMMLIRPVLASSEESLLRPAIVGNVPNSSRVLQALGLTELHGEKEEDTQKSNKQYLYFS